MKFLSSIAILLFFSVSLLSQTPQKMSYQAVIRNSNNDLIASKQIGMQMSILKGSKTGLTVYVETHTAVTNVNGLVSVEIGAGSPVAGSFETIDWSKGPYFIKTETDPLGGTVYSIAGTTELLSVPYALYARSSGSSLPGPQGPIGEKGEPGSKGDAGPQGPTGLTGSQGNEGPQGPKGDTGAQGPIGLTGPKGDTGPQGVQGIQGLLINGASAGNTPFWDGTQWIVNSSNLFNNGGNIGIGTTIPGAKLEIFDNVGWSALQLRTNKSNVGSGIKFKTDNPEVLGQIGVNGSGAGVLANALYITQNGNHPIKFATNFADRMIIGANGNVGIGTLTPSQKLEVVGGINIQKAYYGFTQIDGDVIMGTYVDPSGGWIGTNSNSDFHFFTNDGNPSMTLSTSGNFGIGTTTPQTKLDIIGNIKITDGSQQAGRVLTSDENGVGTWQSNNGIGWSLTGNNGVSGNTDFIGTLDNSPLNFRVNNQKAGSIDPNSESTFLGYQSGISNTSGFNNTAFGFRSLYSNTSGTFNTGFGIKVLYSNTSGRHNTAFGFQSLYSNTEGESNSAIGINALKSNTTGSGNTANGTNTLESNTTGQGNTACGFNALQFNLTGSGNTALGVQSLYQNTTGQRNTTTGYNSLLYNTLGSENTVNGYFSLYQNTTGDQNTGVGYFTLQKNIKGSKNTAIGYMADVSSDSLFNATALGSNAIVMESNTIQLGSSGISKVIAGGDNTTLVTGSVQITGGELGTGKVLTSDANGVGTWQSNNSIGWSLTGNNGVSGGTDFIGTLDNSPLNFRVNNQAAGNIDPNSESTFFGYQTGNSNTSGTFNTGFGYKSLFSNTSGTHNTGLGIKALYSNTSGSRNTAFGFQSLYSNTEGQFNTAFGFYSLQSNTTGLSNTATGSQSLSSNTTGSSNTANGYNALLSNTTGFRNTAIGLQSLYANTTGINNSATGFFSLIGNTTGSENTGNGHLSLLRNTTGSQNTGIGDYALANNISGSKNTAIGYFAGVLSDSLTNATAIGAYAIVKENNTIQLGDSLVTKVIAGKGTTTIVAGSVQITGGEFGVGKVMTSDANGVGTWQSNTANGWSLTGNSGVTDSTNFIGTTSYNALNFRVFNLKAGSIDPNTENTFFGFQSGNVNADGFDNTGFGWRSLYKNTEGSKNTAVGRSALSFNVTGNDNSAFGEAVLFTNTTGKNNTATGSLALYKNSTGSNNTASGTKALYSNTTGNSNIAIGTASLYQNTIQSYSVAVGDSALYNNGIELADFPQSYYNTAFGFKSLFANKTGFSNTAIGYNSLSSNTNGLLLTAVGTDALLKNTTGRYNTATGSSSLYNNITGSDNTATGFQALVSNISGDLNVGIGSHSLTNNKMGHYNTAIGGYSLSAITAGYGNTAIGFNIQASSDSLRNTTAIGANAKINASNKVRIGDAAITVIEGQVDWTFPSDARFKFNIHDDNIPGLAFINKLRPVTYQFNTQKFEEHLVQNSPENRKQLRSDTQDYAESTNRIQTGFLAQDVEQVCKSLNYTFSGLHVPESKVDNYGLAYASFVPLIVKAVQEQQVIIETQNNKIELLEQKINQLLMKFEELSKK